MATSPSQYQVTADIQDYTSCFLARGGGLMSTWNALA